MQTTPEASEWEKLDARWTAESMKRCLNSSNLANRRYMTLQNKQTHYAKALRRQALMWATCAEMFRQALVEIDAAAAPKPARKLAVPILEGPVAMPRLQQ